MPESSGRLKSHSTEVAPRFPHLYVEITNRCNLSCSPCPVQLWEKEPNDLDFHCLIRLLSEFNKHGGRYLTISGGEPGLWKRLPDFLSEVAEMGLETTVYTNGKAVKPEVLAIMKKMKSRLAISLDGESQEIHEKLRGKKTFRTVMDRLETAVAELGGAKVMISSVLSKPLLPFVTRLWNMACSYKVAALYLALFESFPFYEKNLLSPTPEDLIDPVFRLLEAAGKNEKPRLVFSESHDLICVNSIFSERKTENVVGRTIKIQADGWAYPGPFFYDPCFRLGRPFETGWTAVLSSDVHERLRQQAAIRINRVPECRECFWAFRCRGGSLAFTWATHRNWEAPCPLCVLYKATLDRAAKRCIHESGSFTHS